MDRADSGFGQPLRRIALSAVIGGAIAFAALNALDATPPAVTAGGAGLVVTSLETGGASQVAGLRVGDVIDRVDGLDAPTPAMLEQAEDGDLAVLHVAARGDAAARTLLMRHPEEGQGEDPDRRGR
ncbi:hypothetical protein ASE67_01905 [Sphingomonas sp. Leaf23]|uniref:PDZ domain-containing protein n=1 Tax=Sphingomonas sp. Leaf23 TaxID=1735689 RepID=UPI0006FB9452|nr:PDZ domain-containing protein [Sphingomonas sp. Leaf23]KQM88528.1 hypothetical protein ASE67_01905 [Sphingomonas sp. Leaf23]